MAKQLGLRFFVRNRVHVRQVILGFEPGLVEGLFNLPRDFLKALHREGGGHEQLFLHIAEGEGDFHPVFHRLDLELPLLDTVIKAVHRGVGALGIHISELQQGFVRGGRGVLRHRLVNSAVLFVPHLEGRRVPVDQELEAPVFGDRLVGFSVDVVFRGVREQNVPFLHGGDPAILRAGGQDAHHQQEGKKPAGDSLHHSDHAFLESRLWRPAGYETRRHARLTSSL